MEFGVLGPLQVRRDGVLAPLTGRKQQMLLALLLARANEAVSVDTLADAVWGGVPVDRAAQNLQLHVHRLRRALGDLRRLGHEAGGYRLRVMPGELDAEQFEGLVDEATEIADHAPGRCADLLRKALDLWRGSPFEGMDSPGLAAVAARLSDRRLAAIELLYEAELAGGKDAATVAELTDLAREHPLREKLQALLMVALHRGGRQADALRVFREARNSLVDQLGLEPGPQLQELQRQILDGEAVELGARAAPPTAPAQLPADVRGFVGRESQLRQLDGLLVDDRPSMGLAVLAGTAGAGKTALAVHWAHRARARFPDGQLYVDLHGYGPEHPLPPEQALAGFLRSLGVGGAGIPNESGERSARFRSLMDGRRMLIVLDNARTADQVRPLLPGTRSCAVVVTSRDSLTGLGVREGADRIDLDRLPGGEAVRLLGELLGDLAAGSPEATRQLVDQCARLPLALRLAADLVRTRPMRGVAGLVDELADERHRLDLLDVEDDAHSAVRVVFSWSYQQLSSQSKRVFRMCGLHPGHTVHADTVAALVDSDRQVAKQSLNALLRAHLVEETPDGRFRAHDLLRAYALELAETDESAGERVAASDRLLDHYAETAVAAMRQIAPHGTAELARSAPADVDGSPFADSGQARQWLDLERTNIVAATGLRRPQVLRLAVAVSRYLLMGSYLDEALRVHRHAVEAAREIADRTAEAHALRRLGTVYRAAGRYDESARHAELANERYEALGDAVNQALALNNLGTSAIMTGRIRDAKRHFELALRIDGDGDPRDRFGPLVNLVYVLGRLGEFEAGARYCEEASSIAESLGDAVLEAYALYHRAKLAEWSEQLVEAIELADRLIALARDRGIRVFTIEALDILGNVHRALGDYAKAERCHEQALDSARQGDDRHSVVEALNGLGLTRCRMGDPSRALEDHQMALGQAQALGAADEEARALAGIGDAHHARGDGDRAHDCWRRAIGIYDDLGLPESEDVAAKIGVRQ